MGRRLRPIRPIVRLTAHSKDGKPIVVRIEPEGIRLRRKHERTWRSLTWERLYQQAIGEPLLPFMVADFEAGGGNQCLVSSAR